jgi:hypothetical protein
METLRRSDQRKISVFVRELYCLHSIKAISERVVQRIDNLIGGNCAWVLCESKTEAPHLLAENLGPEWQKLQPAASALRHEHPEIRYLTVSV